MRRRLHVSRVEALADRLHYEALSRLHGSWLYRVSSGLHSARMAPVIPHSFRITAMWCTGVELAENGASLRAAAPVVGVLALDVADRARPVW